MTKMSENPVSSPRDHNPVGLRACLGLVEAAMRDVLRHSGKATDEREGDALLQRVAREAAERWTDRATPAIQAGIDAIDFWAPDPAALRRLVRRPGGARLAAALVATAERLLERLVHAEPSFRDHLRMIAATGRSVSDGRRRRWARRAEGGGGPADGDPAPAGATGAGWWCRAGAHRIGHRPDAP